jgi:hypothetical protein
MIQRHPDHHETKQPKDGIFAIADQQISVLKGN